MIPLKDGVYITNIGEIDGYLHIQIRNDANKRQDPGGFLYFADEDGNDVLNTYAAVWYNQKTSDGEIDYEDFIFPISLEEAMNYQLWGAFEFFGGTIDGNWTVTFPVENMG